MNYSGILITLKTDAFEQTLGRLRSLPNLEIFRTQSETGRAVAVIEADAVQAEADLFESVRRTEGVLDVSLINHYFSDDAGAC